MRLQELDAWEMVERHYADVRDVHFRELFAADPAARRSS